MRMQAGVSLSGLLIGAVIVAILAMLGMKVIPEVIEYASIVKIVRKVANDPAAKSSVTEARKSFDRYATVDNISSIGPQDLDVSKEGNDLVISFAYEKRIPLFDKVSLIIYFDGSSKE